MGKKSYRALEATGRIWGFSLSVVEAVRGFEQWIYKTAFTGDAVGSRVGDGRRLEATQ